MRGVRLPDQRLDAGQSVKRLRKAGKEVEGTEKPQQFRLDLKGVVQTTRRDEETVVFRREGDPAAR